MKQPRKRAFSARKAAKPRVSPHRNHKEKPISPQVKTGTKKSQKEEFFPTVVGHAEQYASAFTYADDDFWNAVESLRRTRGGSVEERKNEGRAALNRVRWLENRAYLFANNVETVGSKDDRDQAKLARDNFVLRFVEAVRDRTFPKKRESRARFLGDSLGTDGEKSARRSRDIVGKERAKQKRNTNQANAEFYIRCCGKGRWTINSECPNCKRSPFPLWLQLSF